MISRTDGYVDDVPYVRSFIVELAPAWLDHVALLAHCAPPVRDGGFAWCDLGCGQGVTATMLAATHPSGVFHGIDLMPAHVDHARRFASETGVGNAIFHTADFAAAIDLALPRFDYIVAHGVYSWIGPESQRAVRRFIDRHLKPGGLVYLSYNAMPGWATELPYQRLVRALGETFPGNSIARFATAAEVIRTLTAMNVPALTQSPMVKALLEETERHPVAYLAHEYMNAAWQPLFVTEMRSAMTEIGLRPIGSATLAENYDRFVLGGKAREILAGIEDDDVRELTRDFFIDQRFRRDVFHRDMPAIDGDERRRRLLAGTYALARPSGTVEYAMLSPAGRLSYDNAASRSIVAQLAAGPRRLDEVARQRRLNPQDALANALTLCAASQIRPVEPREVSVGAVNRAVLRRLGGAEEIAALALPSGTGLRLRRGGLDLLASGNTGEDGEQVAWHAFLAPLVS